MERGATEIGAGLVMAKNRSRTDTGRSPLPSHWILDFWKDSVLFIGTPLLIVPALALAQFRFSAEGIGLFVASIGAQGHHLPGLLRAYGDRELFRRYRVRFIVAPVFLLLFCGLLGRINLDTLQVLVLLWGFWHGLAQLYGFMRIYDAKAGATSRWRARLDLATCATWFVGGFLHSPEKVGQTLDAAYSAGMPYLSADAMSFIRAGWGFSAIVITAIFTIYTIYMWRRGSPCSYQKLIVMATGCAFWWYAMVYINPAILGVAAFEIFHDVQYLSIVWIFNRTRVDKGRPVGAFTRFLFRPSAILMAVYLALVFLYGSLAWVDRWLSASETAPIVLYGVAAASGLLHFYYDGFIWKIRESSTGEALGVQSRSPLKGMTPSWFVHGLKWSIFVVPACWLIVANLHADPIQRLEQKRAVADVVPGSADGQLRLGAVLAERGEYAEAVEHYEKALHLKPNDAKARHNIGNCLLALGKFSEAAQQSRRALELNPALEQAHLTLGQALLALGRPRDAISHFRVVTLETSNAEAHKHWANALIALGRYDEAIGHYQEAIRMKPDFTEAQVSWGNALARKSRFSEAVKHYQAAIAINPDLAEAQLFWGNALAATGNMTDAISHYQESIRLKSNDARAHLYLGLALVGMQRFDEAAPHAKEALRLMPNLAEAHLLWGTCLQAQGNVELARKQFEEALRLNPRLEPARNSLNRMRQGQQK